MATACRAMASERGGSGGRQRRQRQLPSLITLIRSSPVGAASGLYSEIFWRRCQHARGEAEEALGRCRCDGKGTGLVITMNGSISSFLLSAAKDTHLPHDLRELAFDLSLQSSVNYRSLRAIWFNSPPSTRPPLRLLFSGSGFIFESPKPREKSEELRERLRKLSEMAERKAYQELVRDITLKEPAEPFSSYKDQLGFGLHVLLVMFTGYLVGFAAFSALFNHSSIMMPTNQDYFSFVECCWRHPRAGVRISPPKDRA